MKKRKKGKGGWDVKTPQGKIDKIYALHQAGLSNSQIGEYLDLNRTTVLNYIKAKPPEIVPPALDEADQAYIAQLQRGSQEREEPSPQREPASSIATQTNGNTPVKKAATTSPKTSSFLRTNNPAEATSVYFVPKAFTASPTLLWQAQKITEIEWGWPQMSTEDFLDTFLYEMMKARGIIIGAYQKIEPEQRNPNAESETEEVEFEVESEETGEPSTQEIEPILEGG